MHIKIYFNDKPLFLTDEISADIEPYAHHDDAVLIDEFSTPGVNSMIHEMRQEKIHAGIFLHHNLAELEKTFRRKFTLVQAAGGLVLNDKGEILMMLRRGKWDLPKGKLDPGESLEHCAVREVQEETGLKKVTLQKPLVVTYHTYDESGKHILKESHWYGMKAPGKQELVPQSEEQITQIKWVTAAEVKQYITNTFPSIIDVLKAGGFL
ncbi:NUDIX hydrolase [Pseudoflavitalea sp. X16]|uniref:NUDIX hydrolase n=1 Tax=Paraflavitalea devenefica TaxID=2716334 RepID=UPI0014230797|nr:NUDIX hydrolase [Paraflavitalea devenefica]NII28067.1 NUDIX hydrolase [Paraflavitalea devenefica]